METNRVLSRVGARLLTEEEMQQVAAALKMGRFFASFNTGPCNFDPITCRVISGDCSDVPPACAG